ncbi:calcium and integrin-binding protein 1-like [Homarus americanus]|uniref:Calcium and integrin-binding protein 1-like 1 n=1 Tax=Homarus americanus TaxID=6706 RepID=A0A8J5N248_HOMAM|nr:calcium and integrin-binding protein 1-like [Homarus americanus]XP_042216371.1 calcium and integrin-binding protein 1-like [Homarus americanus]XP_042216372.1 calcium and integrin-binding protein 1-like [Homarus americanus]XP_042216373.1 calcium and integrin-binding protein 1-like [Homarus americanus]XP_042216374.1 calcium and integrin-binding protein 1-like [Homarus americanus]KAG7171836.1 Calcium and integrin-binding protein 1-like 1 [Homarus americanus]
MGNSKSCFSEEELQDYEDLTYLTRKEILLAWSRWMELVQCQDSSNKSARYPDKVIHQLPELKHNPFCERITRVFSSEHDSRMSFEDFLDLLSVMSDKAPLQLKAFYAFHIFDFNEDKSLDRDDLGLVVDKLTGDSGLLPEEKEKLVDKLLEETDLDGGGISEEEFKHLLTKCPDFIHSFRFSI